MGHLIHQLGGLANSARVDHIRKVASVSGEFYTSLARIFAPLMYSLVSMISTDSIISTVFKIFWMTLLYDQYKGNFGNIIDISTVSITSTV